MILDLFAGPGGVSEGLRSLGLSCVGIERDEAACLTRRAAGHLTIRADVAQYPTAPFAGKVSGLWASPPCQAFSAAGKGLGKKDLPALYAHITACRDGWVDVDPEGWHDPRSPLVLEPLRWVSDLRPEWVACEQVPACLELWRAMAHVFEGWGYSVWAGVLESERYGVPQTRERAILMASRTRAVVPPEPTHRRYVKGESNERDVTLFGDGLLPWISMADALGWADGDVWRGRRGEGMCDRHGERPDRPATEPAPTLPSSYQRTVWRVRTGTNQAPKGPGHRDGPWRERSKPYERDVTDPAPTLDGKALGAWTLRMGNQDNACERNLDEPAPTAMFGHRANDNRWVLQNRRDSEGWKDTDGERDPRPADEPAPTISGEVYRWPWERPATTIVGSFEPDTVSAPGYRTEVSRQDAEGSVKIELWEALVLQGFPPDYPVQGFKSKQGEQVGNAVPPPLAAAVVAALTDRERVAA